MSVIHCAWALQDMPLLKLAPALADIAASGLSHWHIDVSDGIFVPQFGCGETILQELAAVSPLPCHVHLLATRPERHVERLVAAGAAAITVHVEACNHAHRVVNQIRNAGASPGIAIGPTTPLTKLDYLLGEVDRVLVCTRDLDGRGPQMISSGPERVKILGELIRYNEFRTIIEAEGVMNTRNAALLYHFGARHLVLDAHSFAPAGLTRETLKDFLSALLVETKVL